MKNNRRDFLKLTGLAGLGLSGAGFISNNENAFDGDFNLMFQSTLIKHPMDISLDKGGNTGILL